MHTYSFLSLYLVVIAFSLSLSLSLSLSQIDCIWQPSANHKSTLAKNPLGSGSSSSDPLVLPLHVRFRDGKAQQDFLENFQKRGVHLYCPVGFFTLLSLWLFELGAENLFVRYP